MLLNSKATAPVVLSGGDVRHDITVRFNQLDAQISDLTKIVKAMADKNSPAPGVVNTPKQKNKSPRQSTPEEVRFILGLFEHFKVSMEEISKLTGVAYHTVNNVAMRRLTKARTTKPCTKAAALKILSQGSTKGVNPDDK